MDIREIRKEIRKYSKEVYYKDSEDQLNRENMLVVSHTLKRGGAPMVLLEWMGFFKQNYNVIVVALEDGELALDFANEGFEVYVLKANEFVNMPDSFWDFFDVAFLNTIMCYGVLKFFQDRKTRVLWWLHEPEVLFKINASKMELVKRLSTNIIPLAITGDTASYVKKYFDIDIPIMHMGLRDMYCENDERNHEKTVFFMPAAFQAIKGQDIAVKAILQLPNHYQKRACFVFAGMFDENYSDWYNVVKKLAEALPETVKMLGCISKKEVYDWYKKSDCVIAPSRADATPTTIVEGMMFRKLCIVSDATGISKYMHNGLDGFVFRSENDEELKNIFVNVIDNYELMEKIRDEGRNIFLQYFEQNVVFSQLATYLAKGKDSDK